MILIEANRPYFETAKVRSYAPHRFQTDPSDKLRFTLDEMNRSCPGNKQRLVQGTSPTSVSFNAKFIILYVPTIEYNVI
jgi:hypothetical protein